MAATSLRKNTNAYKKLEAFFYLIKQEQGLEAANKIMGKDLKTKPTDTNDRHYNVKLQLYDIVKNVDSNNMGRVLRTIKSELRKCNYMLIQFEEHISILTFIFLRSK